MERTIYSSKEQPWVLGWHHCAPTCLREVRATVPTDPEQAISSVVEVHRRCVRHLETRRPILEHVSTGVETMEIKFTADWCAQEVTFLDTRVYIKNGRVETDLHVKLTSKHQYPHTKSSHPKHCKTAIPYSQAFRTKRICWERENLLLRTNQLKHHLSKREYSNQLLDSEINRAINTSYGSSSSRSNWRNQIAYL